MKRRGATAACLLLAAVAVGTPGSAHADGDPASDMLVMQNVFLPYAQPSRAASAALTTEVAAAYAAGFRVKVALVATKVDLGAIPSLFGKPAQYAAFLGRELGGFYGGPLLVVMPSGYGIYDAGRSTTAEQRVLGRLASPGSSAPDALAGAATNAVTRLLHAGALRSKDILKPYLDTILARAAGVKLTVQYYLSDDSGKATATLTLENGGDTVLTLHVPEHATSILRPETRHLTLPSGLALAGLRVCVTSTDPSGNQAQSCKKVGG